ncbi:MAG: D-amino peptidase [Clostridiales bacterium]|jgi:D-amino peptidase|nr:D-amino peptidase [Clostridiales bacterium]MDN5283535.1 D-amino peptidase [Candidatus Ozemobacter sp.]
MKIYIIADMEGIAGVVSKDQTEGSSSHLEVARLQYTREVKAVCEAAIEEGVEEIYINDFHGNGLNLIPEKLPEEAMVIRGGFRPSSGFDLLDKTFSGLVMLGVHARTATGRGVIPHTYSQKISFEMFGQPVGEFDLLSLIAGECKVPTLLVSGDSIAIEQARTNLPSTHMVITKFPVGTESALCIHPNRVLTQLKDEMRRAVKNIQSIEPPQIAPPLQLLIKLHDVTLAHRLEWIPGIKKVDDTTFEYLGKSMKEIANVVYGTTTLAECKF